MAKVAFVGLGVMGFPMAGHLAAKGHDVTVYNRTFAKAEAWTQKHKGKAVKTPKEAATSQEIVFCCVGNDDDLRAVVLGDDGAFAGMAKGAIFVDNTTASADIARELHALGKKKGIEFIDAPVSGGQAGAENGQLTVMCGGEQAIFDKAKPVADAYAKAMTLIGPPGSGQITKMMNQMCIAGIVQGLAEATAIGAGAWSSFAIRKEAKDHGVSGRLAGALLAGDKVVITEDTVTRGASPLEAARVVRELGADPVMILVIVDRGGTCAALAAAEGIAFHALVTAPDLGFDYEGA